MTQRDPTHSPIQIERARQLRRDSPDAEELVWRRLRDRQLGDKIRRQHRIGPFIVDFFCPRAKLAIELDGGQHYTDEGREYDRARTRSLEHSGVRVVRFSNAEVLTEMDAVIERIRELLAEI